MAADAAKMPGVALATFGDMLRVPWSGTTLERERSQGADVRLVYSPADAITLAASEPRKEIVFFAVGFETTAPLTAAAVQDGQDKGLRNFSVLSQHRLIPPAIRALLDSGRCRIDGFILPGHVSTVTGRNAFSFLASEYGVPGAVTGFTPGELLLGLLVLLVCLARGEQLVVNAYPGVVTETGNQAAARLVGTVFDREQARWRGLGVIPASGLQLRRGLGEFDARLKLGLAALPARDDEDGCLCGDVLAGRMTPPDCGAFGVRCTPVRPLGPCMVSGEGSCSAFYRYDRASTPGREVRRPEAGEGRDEETR
jgi:hydrogenase expression/formation protein HypD